MVGVIVSQPNQAKTTTITIKRQNSPEPFSSGFLGIAPISTIGPPGYNDAIFPKGNFGLARSLQAVRCGRVEIKIQKQHTSPRMFFFHGQSFDDRSESGCVVYEFSRSWCHLFISLSSLDNKP